MNLQVTETFNNTSIAFYDDRYRQIVSMGGSRSSKSYSILQILMLELIYKKNIKITVWRDTKVTCRATVMEDFQKIIMFDENIFADFKENKQSGTFLYKPTNSKIVFEGADNIGKVLGGAQDISFFNEVTEFSKDVYLQITQRTAGKVICDYNPSKDFWLENYRNDDRTVFIHSNFTHNAFCPENIVNQLKSYEPWETGSYDIINSEVYYKDKIVTEENQPPPNFKNIKSGTANTYMWLVYGLGIGSEKPNKIYHGWRKISEEDFDKLEYTSYFGLDFGSKNPTALTEVKTDGDNNFWICPRMYKSMSQMPESLPRTIETSVKMNVSSDIIICDSAKQAYIDQMTMYGFMAVGATKGTGSVSAGISLVQKCNIFYVSDDNIDKEYRNYSWKVDRYNKATDEPDKKDDHYMDSIRYAITYIIYYLNMNI